MILYYNCMKEGQLQRIPEIHPAYAPLHYIFMFPKGEDGWHPFIPLRSNKSSTINQKSITEEIFSDEDEENESKYVTAMNYFT